MLTLQPNILLRTSTATATSARPAISSQEDTGDSERSGPFGPPPAIYFASLQPSPSPSVLPVSPSRAQLAIAYALLGNSIFGTKYLLQGIVGVCGCGGCTWIGACTSVDCCSAGLNCSFAGFDCRFARWAIQTQCRNCKHSHSQTEHKCEFSCCWNYCFTNLSFSSLQALLRAGNQVFRRLCKNVAGWGAVPLPVGVPQAIAAIFAAPSPLPGPNATPPIALGFPATHQNLEIVEIAYLSKWYNEDFEILPNDLQPVQLGKLKDFVCQ
ncbi:hypothetical protein BDR26DRAFT_864982 [Obelidium mucronatum]|nr:hypothetical protein BDR26DRAFT_864982 [Obelidium mucronatum]